MRNQNLEKHNYSHLQILFDKFQHTKDGILILFTATVNTEQLPKKIFSKITDFRMKFCKKAAKYGAMKGITSHINVTQPRPTHTRIESKQLDTYLHT